MQTRTRRALLLAPALFMAAALLAVPSGPVAAAAPAPTLPLHWTVNATTHVKKLDVNVTPPPGSFTGSVNLSTGKVVGHLSLPPAHTTIRLAGVGLVTATFVVQPVKPVRGRVDFTTLRVTTHSVFRVLVPSVTPLGLPINLVPSTCGTARPVHLSLGGPINLTGANTFRGAYRIPLFSRCGSLTLPFDLALSGPGNTFSATFSPS